MITCVTELCKIKTEYTTAKTREHVRILICAGTGCIANGSMKVYDEFKRLVETAGNLVDIELLHEDDNREGDAVVPTGCLGFCGAGPLVRIEPLGVLYTYVKPEDAAEILQATNRGGVVARLVYQNPETGEPYTTPEESPFYNKQRRQVLERVGRIAPESIYEYIAADGYQGLAKALTMTPLEVNNEISASGLRGRGGAGFPTGKKWEFARVQKNEPKYVVCNADEGDPGAFMNCSLMEGDPHRVLEGMIIAGYAIGASHGVIYIRAEYPLAVRRIQAALKSAEDAGLLGDNILGSGFSFHCYTKLGAGAFVCGEETALLASVEGKRGMPKPKPPFPAVSGLYGMPTIIDNVETLGNIAAIIAKGAEWFKQSGSTKSPGTKTFSLTGKVKHTGLVEIPLGTTLREMIYDIGGGILNDKKFKAVQIGGPSGGCLPEQQLDLPMDYDTLQAAGAMVGSGGLVVTDESNCIVEFARFFMQFIASESCGKCVACREGTKQMLALLTKIIEGKAEMSDIDLLEELALVVKDASLCGLGKTAGNPVLSTLRYFRDEYVAHVRDHRCPAGVCTAFRKFYIVADKCKGCGRCAKACPAAAISGELRQPFVIDQDKCVHCGACVETCRFDAVEEKQ
ncbi:MAG: NADH-ubiquinone oxidoreductase-F iron-sulfur binding region domain-containing protein [Anaerolineae bacterium]